jgi:hypothetical protein
MVEKEEGNDFVPFFFAYSGTKVIKRDEITQ